MINKDMRVEFPRNRRLSSPKENKVNGDGVWVAANTSVLIRMKQLQTPHPHPQASMPLATLFSSLVSFLSSILTITFIIRNNVYNWKCYPTTKLNNLCLDI